MKNKLKITEISTITFYIVAIAVYITLAIKTKDADKFIIAVWIFYTMSMFILYRQADRLGDESTQIRDEIIKKQFEVIKILTNPILNEITNSNKGKAKENVKN